MEPSRSIAEDGSLNPASLAVQVSTIREMLRLLDTQTIAGQRHLMAKVVALVGPHIEQAIRHVGPGNRRIVVEQLALLRSEAARPFPSVAMFGRRADGLLTLLAEMGALRWNAPC